jgi:hypothetical protein
MGGWNFTEELAPHTNLTWIHVGLNGSREEAIAEILRRLQQASDAGVQAALSIDPFLFVPEVGELKPDSEIEEFLVELRAQIEFSELLDAVAMIYPKDEPFRELINERDPSFIDKNVTGDAYKEIHRDLVHVNNLIKLVFPDTPIGVILSGYELHHFFFSIPENYDWVGFDCYQDLFRSCDNRSFTEHYSHLLEYMQPHQRLMAVPETWALNEAMDRPDWPQVLTRRLLHHYEIVLNEPRFVAIVPFLWSFDANAPTPGLGLNRFPELYDDGVNNAGSAFVEVVRQIGEQVKHGQPVHPNLAYHETEDSPHRPSDMMTGEIREIGNNGLIHAWAYSEALPHKNLKVQLLIRDIGGRVIYKSRPERTDRRDEQLEQMLDDGPLIGLHGYSYQLPPRVVARAAWQDLNIELVTFADGEAREEVAIDRRRFTTSPNTPPPVVQRTVDEHGAVSRPNASKIR